MRFRVVSIVACTAALAVLVAGVAVASSVATTKRATSVTKRAATLHGIVDARPTGSAWLFEYGTTRALGSFSQTKSIGSGRRSVAWSVRRLKAGSTYYFRLVVIQGGYMSTAAYGKILSVRTKRH
ncbi:MAG TPA: hypothetical protein VG365_03340 [Solirubrobacteraceae bacterium]|nr:hypothetical protein [Solirubrobacteraceae bacterium]